MVNCDLCNTIRCRGSRKSNITYEDLSFSRCVSLTIIALMFGVLFSILVGCLTINCSTQYQVKLLKIAKKSIRALLFNDNMQSAFRSCAHLDWYRLDNEIPYWMENGITASAALVASSIAIILKLGCSVALAIIIPLALLAHRSFVSCSVQVQRISAKITAGSKQEN